MTVDIGTDFDWTDSVYKEERKTRIDGRDWVDKIRSEQEKAISEQASASGKLVIRSKGTEKGMMLIKCQKNNRTLSTLLLTLLSNFSTMTLHTSQWVLQLWAAEVLVNRL